MNIQTPVRQTTLMQEIDPAIVAAALSLSIKQGQVLTVLMDKVLTPLRVLEERTGSSPGACQQIIFHLRARLAKQGVRIVTHPGFGYSIPKEDRQRVHAIVADFRSI